MKKLTIEQIEALRSKGVDPRKISELMSFWSKQRNIISRHIQLGAEVQPIKAGR